MDSFHKEIEYQLSATPRLEKGWWKERTGADVFKYHDKTPTLARVTQCY